jgi:hypothetical protein
MSFGTLRDDSRIIVMNESMADALAERMARRFHAAQHKAKGGKDDGSPGVNPRAANQYGGKAIIKYNPSSDERQTGIAQEVSLINWMSPDGLPHYVTIDVGRLAGGYGGPGNDARASSLGVGDTGIGGGTWPLGVDVNAPDGAGGFGVAYFYRATAQVLIGLPGAMQDPFYIDLNRGQRITALASYVVVTVAMGPPPPIPTFRAPRYAYASGSMAVYATLGPAVAPSIAPVLFTQYTDITDGVDPQFVKVVPPRANKLVALQSSNDAAQAAELWLLDNPGNLIGAIPFTTCSNAIGSGNTPEVVIPEDCYSLLVKFHAGADNTSKYEWRLVYQLSV